MSISSNMELPLGNHSKALSKMENPPPKPLCTNYFLRDRDEPEQQRWTEVKRVIEEVKLRRQSIHHRDSMNYEVAVGNVELAKELDGT